uniref:ENT domain-containing protein n=1 Tax=Ciona savignyi TaxID=51511 RepID=H2YVZ1_CIOSA
MPPVNCHGNSYNLNEQDSILALRQFELEAYSSTLTALRAEGELNDEKRELLGHLQSMLGITKERHKAEVRRAVNDEKLTSVACSLNRGNPCATEWEKEGRHVMSLPIRPTPITANTQLADYIANITAMENRNILLGRYRTDDNEESITMEDRESQPTWDVVPMKKRKLMNDLNKLDASTSTLDLEKYINPPE